MLEPMIEALASVVSNSPGIRHVNISCCERPPSNSDRGCQGSRCDFGGGALAPYRQIPNNAVVLAAPSAAAPHYTEPRPGKLCPAQVAAIVGAVAAGRTLRDVAADFGISAERVRQLARA